jgi:hypothetical protein
MKPFLPSKGLKHSALVVILCLPVIFGFTKPADKFILPGSGKLFNAAPVVGDDYAHLLINTTITESYFQNDFDPDGDSLSLNGMTINVSAPAVLIETISTTQGGAISFYSNGMYTYTPAVNFWGNDQVVYQLCDINAMPLCTTASIYFNVRTGPLLPLAITSFSGKKAGKDVLLQWTTAQDNNSGHFEVLHSTSNNSFTKLATVAVQGNNTTASYSFVYNNPSAVINYYRIKLVNKDGSAIYSKVVAIKSDGEGVMLQTVYPNPFRDKLELAISTDKAGIISIHLYDMSGKLAKTQSKQVTLGLNIITLRGLNTLQPGNYFIDVSGSNNILKTKLYKTQ